MKTINSNLSAYSTRGGSTSLMRVNSQSPATSQRKRSVKDRYSRQEILKERYRYSTTFVGIEDVRSLLARRTQARSSVPTILGLTYNLDGELIGVPDVHEFSS